MTHPLSTVHPFRGRTWDPSRPVEVYRNLHHGGHRGYSVRQDGLVVGHVSAVLLQDCTFVVSDAGARRAVREGRRNVHAWIRGTVVASAMDTDAVDPRPLPVRVTYVLGRGFRSSSTDRRLQAAGAVKIRPGSVSAAYTYEQR